MEVPEEYLMQHYLTYVPNPSDDSDFEELPYESIEKIDIAILNRRSEVEIGRIDRENERKLKAKHYFINKNVYSSIFNLPGLECVKYTHKIIDLKLKPIKFSIPEIFLKDFICDRTYRVVLKYKIEYERWILKKNYVPCRDEIIEIFQSNVYDKDLKNVITRIYETLRTHTKNLALYRQKRKEAFLLGEEITLTEDEERLFLTEKELRRKRKKENKIWKRMLLPEHQQIDNINRISINREKEKKYLDLEISSESIERNYRLRNESTDSSENDDFLV